MDNCKQVYTDEYYNQECQSPNVSVHLTKPPTYVGRSYCLDCCFANCFALYFRCFTPPRWRRGGKTPSTLSSNVTPVRCSKDTSGNEGKGLGEVSLFSSGNEGPSMGSSESVWGIDVGRSQRWVWFSTASLKMDSDTKWLITRELSWVVRCVRYPHILHASSLLPMSNHIKGKESASVL